MYRAVEVIRGGGDGVGSGAGSAHLIGDGDGVGGMHGSAHLVVDVGEGVGGMHGSAHLIVDGDGVGGIADAAHSDEVGGDVWGMGSTHRDSVVDEVSGSGSALGVGGASVGIVGAGVGVCCCSAASSAMADRNMSLRPGSEFAV